MKSVGDSQDPNKGQRCCHPTVRNMKSSTLPSASTSSNQNRSGGHSKAQSQDSSTSTVSLLNRLGGSIKMPKLPTAGSSTPASKSGGLSQPFNDCDTRSAPEGEDKTQPRNNESDEMLESRNLLDFPKTTADFSSSTKTPSPNRNNNRNNVITNQSSVSSNTSSSSKSWASFGNMAKAVGCGVSAFSSGVVNTSIAAAQKTSTGVINSSIAVGEGVVQGTKAVGEGVYQGTKAVGEGVYHGTKVVGEGVYQGTKAVGEGVVKNTKAAGRASVNVVQDTKKWVIDQTESLISLDDTRIHTVTEADTLDEISKQYKIKRTDLIKANRLSSHNLRVGNELIIPATPTTSTAENISNSELTVVGGDIVGSSSSPTTPPSYRTVLHPKEVLEVESVLRFTSKSVFLMSSSSMSPSSSNSSSTQVMNIAAADCSGALKVMRPTGDGSPPYILDEVSTTEPQEHVPAIDVESCESDQMIDEASDNGIVGTIVLKNQEFVFNSKNSVPLSDDEGRETTEDTFHLNGRDDFDTDDCMFKGMVVREVCLSTSVPLFLSNSELMDMSCESEALMASSPSPVVSRIDLDKLATSTEKNKSLTNVLSSVNDESDDQALQSKKNNNSGGISCFDIFQREKSLDGKIDQAALSSSLNEKMVLRPDCTEDEKEKEIDANKCYPSQISQRRYFWITIYSEYEDENDDVLISNKNNKSGIEEHESPIAYRIPIQWSTLIVEHFQLWLKSNILSVETNLLYREDDFLSLDDTFDGENIIIGTTNMSTDMLSAKRRPQLRKMSSDVTESTTVDQTTTSNTFYKLSNKQSLRVKTPVETVRSCSSFSGGTLISPSMSSMSSILSRRVLKQLRTAMPQDVALMHMNLVYSTQNDGFSLANFYRTVSATTDTSLINNPYLMAVKDDEGKVFGAYLTCPPVQTDAFEGTGMSWLFGVSSTKKSTVEYDDTSHHQPPGEDDYYLTMMTTKKSATLPKRAASVRVHHSKRGDPQHESQRCQQKDYCNVKTVRVHNWTHSNDYFYRGNPDSIVIGASDGKFGIYLDGDMFRGRIQAVSTFKDWPHPDIGSKDFKVKCLECWIFR